MAFSIVLFPSLIFFAPIFINEFILDNYFYPIELFFIELIAGILVLSLCNLDR